MEKNIGSYCCSCNRTLYSNKEVIMLNPCEHMVHAPCFSSKTQKKCPKCNITITSITKLNDYKKNPELYQQCVDILSMTNCNNFEDIHYNEIIHNTVDICRIIYKLMRTRGHNAIMKLDKFFMQVGNVKINVSGYNNIKPGKKVFIANHTSFFDIPISYYILNAGFIGAKNLKNNPAFNAVMNILPHVTTDLGKKGENTVDKMKKYVDDHGSLCIFPEGMLSHPKTICKFRSGAFNIGYPV